MKIRSFFLFAAWLANAACACAADALWIAPPKPAGAGSWLCFRKEIELPSKQGRAMVTIAADSKYWLWVNGRMAVFEGQLKRGPTPRDTYADEVDLAPYLQPGKNTVAALVWYFGKDGFSHHDSGKAAFLLSGSGALDGLSTGGGWKALRHPAYGAAGDPLPNFRLPESNIRFDARRDPGDWTAPGFDDSAWPRAKEMGAPPRAPWGTLVTRPIPQWKRSELLDYAGDVGDAGRFPRVSDGRDIRMRLPCNAQITPYFKIEAPAGFLIDIRTDDYEKGHDPAVRSEYVTRDGVQEFEAYGWMNGHEVHYAIPAGVKILALKYRESGYDADFAGRFRCDDEALNRLWEKARRTLYVNMRDTYMDCPDRERAQWWGDVTLHLGQAFYVFDAQRGPLLARKGMLELAAWAREDGSIYSPVPSGISAARSSQYGGQHFFDGSWNRELPQQMLAAIHGFAVYYLYTGDRETIAAVYPAVRRYLGLWRFAEDGLAMHRPGEWDWTDAGEGADVPVIENAWLCLALKAAAKMARATGHDADAKRDEERAASLATAFARAFWKGDHYRSDGHQGAADDRANAMAVVAGLAGAREREGVLKVLASTRHAGPYMEKYVLEALFLLRAPEAAFARMKERYGPMIEDGYSTLWEFFGAKPGEPGRGTYNHAWSGGPLTLLGQYGAGIAPVSAGWETFEVAPQPGPLKAIGTTVPTPRGNVELSLRREAGRCRMELTVPPGTRASVKFPPRPAGETWSTLSRNGKPGPFQETVECGPGRYQLEAF